MANTEKLGDLKGNVEKENVKNQTNADKLGSVQGEKGKLAAWYAKNKKIIDIIFFAVIIVILLAIVYYQWLAPKWNNDASQNAQPSIAQVVQNSTLSTDTATLKAALEAQTRLKEPSLKSARRRGCGPSPIAPNGLFDMNSSGARARFVTRRLSIQPSKNWIGFQALPPSKPHPA